MPIITELRAIKSINLRKSAHSLEGRHSLKKNPTFRESIVGPKLVPSELPRTQGVVPRTIFLRSHIHVEQTESQKKKGNNKRLIADPPPHLTSLGQRCIWPAATGLDCEVALVRSRAAHGPQ